MLGLAGLARKLTVFSAPQLERRVLNRAAGWFADKTIADVTCRPVPRTPWRTSSHLRQRRPGARGPRSGCPSWRMASRYSGDQEVAPSRDWDSWIRENLARSKCAVVFWSAVSLESPNVRHEATIADRAGKLIPVLLEPLRADQFPMGARSRDRQVGCAPAGAGAGIGASRAGAEHGRCRSPRLRAHDDLVCLFMLQLYFIIRRYGDCCNENQRRLWWKFRSGSYVRLYGVAVNLSSLVLRSMFFHL